MPFQDNNLQNHKNETKKVLLLENVHKDALDFFTQKGFQVDFIDHALNKDELSATIKDYHIIGLKSKTHLTQDIFSKAENLEAVGLFAVGSDNVDLDFAKEKNIPVFNAPFSNTRSVVEMVVAEMVVLLRNFYDKSLSLKRGYWHKDWQKSFESRGKNLGIFGYGNIGSQVGELAEAFGFNVFYYDAFDKEPKGNATKCNSIEELLEVSDVLSLHTFAQPGKPVFRREHFQMAKQDLVILNYSRGSVMDYEALVEFIKKGKILGAGIDVFPDEPKSNYQHFYHELQHLPNVILTPHIGGSSEEAQKDMANYLPPIIMEYLETGDTSKSLNLK